MAEQGDGGHRGGDGHAPAQVLCAAGAQGRRRALRAGRGRAAARAAQGVSLLLKGGLAAADLAQ